MSCISTKVTMASEPCNVQVSKDKGIEVIVSDIMSTITAAVTFVSSLIVKATYIDSGINTAVVLENGVDVEVGIICTVQISDELEIWWTDNWKALWDNGKRMLWQQE